MTALPPIEDPPGFNVRVELEKAAFEHGYRLARGTREGWQAWASTTARGLIHLAGCGPTGPWLLALEHPGVIAELGLPPADLPGPGAARYRFATLAELYAALAAVYRLAVSLPDAPLAVFEERIRDLPRGTEAERVVVQRVGQEVFRDALMTYWHGLCPMTGIPDPALLRASHIKPWADCTEDAERLDVHNGLLLSALWDAAFDRGLVTFADDGTPIFSDDLSARARSALTPGVPRLEGLTVGHRANLAWHRDHVFSGPVMS